ncbi:MAG: hypothetical protein SWJ54_25300 [Cyanobacteriota bacterium]|nr:hypothetical protein [Cyanobacteriota bacterium]
MKLKRLHEFRQNVYDQMGAVKDAVFELIDEKSILMSVLSIITQT